MKEFRCECGCLLGKYDSGFFETKGSRFSTITRMKIGEFECRLCNRIYGVDYDKKLIIKGV